MIHYATPAWYSHTHDPSNAALRQTLPPTPCLPLPHLCHGTGNSCHFRSWPCDSGLMGTGLASGVAARLICSVTSTSSPTRSTAPLGPAQAYWPKTGLSAEGVLERLTNIGLFERLTWVLLVHSSVLHKESVELLRRCAHYALRQVRIQTQTPHGFEQTAN